MRKKTKKKESVEEKCLVVFFCLFVDQKKKKEKKQSPQYYSSSLLLCLPLFFFSKRKRCCHIIIIVMTPPPTKTAQHQGKQQQQQHPANKQKKKELVDLECDDEFEEFEEEGASQSWFFFCILGENWISSIVPKNKRMETTRESFLKTFFLVSRCFSLARSFGERVTEGPLSLSLSPPIFLREPQSGREKTRKKKTWRSGRTTGTTRKRTISRRT